MLLLLLLLCCASSNYTICCYAFNNHYETTIIKNHYRKPTSSLHFARNYAPNQQYPDDDNQRAYIAQVDKPTQTLLATPTPPSLPAKPTILVLGATGRIGRLIISTLMEQTDLDCVIIAHVRNYDKALEVLYDYHDDDDDDDDDDDLEITNTAQYLKRKNYALVSSTNQKREGPELKIVVGDLVSRQDVRYALEKQRRRKRQRQHLLNKILFWKKKERNFNATMYEDEDEDDLIEIEYPTSSSSSSKKSTTTTKKQISLNEETLLSSITQSTIIISAISTLRYTNFISDFLCKPWRIFQKDVSHWCVDKHHPYYVCYRSISRVVKWAEQEELRREEIRQNLKKKEEQDKSKKGTNDDVYIPTRPTNYYNTPSSPSSSQQTTTTPNDKIKIIQISSLALAQNKPYGFETVVTNLFCSLVYRYQQMSENVVLSSDIVDTIVLRPGDLVDEERNVTTTSLQVSSTGTVPQPSKVSRSDVAELAVAAALSRMDINYDDDKKKQQQKKKNHDNTISMPNDNIPKSNGAVKKQNDNNLQLNQQQETREARHLTLGVRWASETLKPEPQGYKKDGYSNAQSCMEKVLKEDNKRIKRSRRLEWKKRRKYLREIEQEYESSIASLLSNVVTKTKTSSSLLQQKRASWLKRRQLRKVKPYGVFVAIPVYTMMIWTFTSIFGRYIVLPKNKSMWTFMIKRLSALFLIVKKSFAGGGASAGGKCVGI